MGEPGQPPNLPESDGQERQEGEESRAASGEPAGNSPETEDECPEKQAGQTEAQANPYARLLGLKNIKHLEPIRELTRKEYIQENVSIAAQCLGLLLTFMMAFIIIGFVLALLTTPEGTASFAPLTGLEVEAAVHRRAAPDKTWPGFSPLKYPLAIYDGKKTYLFRHPKPPKEFKLVQGRKNAFVYDGQYEGVWDSMKSKLNDKKTAMVILNWPVQLEKDYYAGVCIHELFHVYQDECEEIWPSGDPEATFFYPRYDIKLYKTTVLEERALANALSAKDAATCRQWSALACSLAEKSHKMMPKRCAETVMAREMREGLAAYVEPEFSSQEELVRNLEEGYWPDEYSSRVYAVGNAYAKLLDRIRPDWKKAFSKKSYTYLSDLLSKTLANTKANDGLFSQEYTDAVDKRARERMTDAIHARVLKTRRFASKDGKALVLEAGREPLYIFSMTGMGMNQALGGMYLSERGVGVGNNYCKLELSHYPTLLEPYPYNGKWMRFYRVVVRGLPDKWDISYEGDTLHVQCGTMSGEFKNASYTLKERNLTVILDD